MLQLTSPLSVIFVSCLEDGTSGQVYDYINIKHSQ
jgi:hypothetical protein